VLYSEKIVCQALLEWAQDAGADVWTLVTKVNLVRPTSQQEVFTHYAFN
jgi:hypothetical protein